MRKKKENRNNDHRDGGKVSGKAFVPCILLLLRIDYLRRKKICVLTWHCVCARVYGFIRNARELIQGRKGIKQTSFVEWVFKVIKMESWLDGYEELSWIHQINALNKTFFCFLKKVAGESSVLSVSREK